MSRNQLTIGRIVRFVMPAEALDAAHKACAGTAVPAIVVGVQDVVTGSVNLTIFPDGVSMGLPNTMHRQGVRYDRLCCAGTWHWPGDVDAQPAETKPPETQSTDAAVPAAAHAAAD